MVTKEHLDNVSSANAPPSPPQKKKNEQRSASSEIKRSYRKKIVLQYMWRYIPFFLRPTVCLLSLVPEVIPSSQCFFFNIIILFLKM